VPDLINPGDYKDEVLSSSDGSFIMIGSPRANHWTGLFLEQMYNRWRPRVTFGADPESPDLRDVRVRVTKDGEVYLPDGFVDTDRRTLDFGFIIRAANPWNSHRMILIIAGRTALGTHAAASAAVSELAIGTVKDRLEGIGISLDDHEQPFCVICQQSAGNGDRLPISDSLTVINTIRFHKLGE